MDLRQRKNAQKRKFDWHVDEAAQRFQSKSRKLDVSDCATEAQNLIFASTSQADEEIFSPESVGNQCFAMGIVWLMRASQQPLWSERALNATLIVGDDFYRAIIDACAKKNYFPMAGYLEPGDLRFLDPNCRVFGHRWKLDFDDNQVSIKI